jgi:hypothetical protein
MKPYQTPKPEKIWLSKCVFDEENPNEMSTEQDVSLGRSLGEFGMLGDLIVVEPLNKKDQHFVHHGEHRIKKLLEAGNKWAWGFIEHMSKLKHKAYRQSMNKLRGSHDPEKDRKELEYFAKANKLEFLSALIATPKEVLLLTQETPPLVTTDANPVQHYHDSFLEGNIKQIHLIFTNESFLAAMEKLEILHKDFETDNNTEVFEKLLDYYWKAENK